MALALRIEGVNIPGNKHICIGLTAIFGVGRQQAMKICKAAGVNPATKGSDVTADQEKALRAETAKLETGGDLRRAIMSAQRRLIDIKCYRGLRTKLRLPRRGQNTRNNAKTARRGEGTFV